MSRFEELSFAKGYKKSFASFKKEFENSYAIIKYPPKEQEAKLKEAYKAATGKEAEEKKENERIPTTKKKSRKPTAE